MEVTLKFKTPNKKEFEEAIKVVLMKSEEINEIEKSIKKMLDAENVSIHSYLSHTGYIEVNATWHFSRNIKK